MISNRTMNLGICSQIWAVGSIVSDDMSRRLAMLVMGLIFLILFVMSVGGEDD